MLNLATIFDSLERPASSLEHKARFSAQPIPDHPEHRIAKDIQGRPTLLISITDNLENLKPAPIKLEHISVQYEIDCRVSNTSETVENKKFTILSCVVDDETLHTYFLYTAAILVGSLSSDPLYHEIIGAVNSFVELFRSMTEPPRKPVQGLWAELFLITQANDINTMIEAWHTTPESRYDFCLKNQRIEVKSSSKRIRQHHFSLDQLSPPANTYLVVASVFVEQVGSGVAILDFIEKIRIRTKSDPKLLLKTHKIISSTIGNSWRSVFDLQFDIELAGSSLLFFSSSTIPSISQNIPPGISDIHFKSDLTNCNPINPQSLRTMGGLFRASLNHSETK